MYGVMLIKLPGFKGLLTGVSQSCAVWDFAQAFCMLESCDGWGGWVEVVEGAPRYHAGKLGWSGLGVLLGTMLESWGGRGEGCS